MKSKLVSASGIVKTAYLNKYAITHVNINNLEWTKAVLEIAQETSTPIILGVSPKAIKHMGGLHTIVAMVENLMIDLKISVPVSLHLDHGDYETAIEATKLGFSSVMFDGSRLSFVDNYEKTKKLCELAKTNHVSVEAEVGSIGQTENGVTVDGELARIDEAKKMASLPIFALAAGIGNIHGVYPKNWNGLNLKHLQTINENVRMPLVLHGGSGIPYEQIKKAISLGIAKFNVSTDLLILFTKYLREYIESGYDLDIAKKGYDPRKIIDFCMKPIKNKIKELFELCGCIGKAK